MAKKRINRRKQAIKKSKKRKKYNNSIVIKLLKKLIQPLFMCLIIFCLYISLAFIIHFFDEEYTTVSGQSTALSVTSNQVSYLVGTKNAKTIPRQVYKMITNADQLLLLDFQNYPTFAKGKKFYKLLVDVQKKKPSLSIFVIANNKMRNSSSDIPIEFKELKRAGINVVFTDSSITKTYHWVYAPIVKLASYFLSDSLSSYFKKKISNNNKRDVIISQSDGKITALTGCFSLDKNNGRFEMVIKLSDASALPILKSELLLIRKQLDSNDNPKGDRSVTKDTEANLKRAFNAKFPNCGNINFEYISEAKIEPKINSILSEVVEGDNVDIIVGTLTSESVINSIIMANKAGANVRIILDKNSGETSSKPDLPNVLSAYKLHTKGENIKIQWLEGHTTQLSFIHVYNNKNKDKVLLLTCPISEQYISGYNLAAACYVENNLNSSERLITLFNAYSNNNATRKIYSTRYEKQPITTAEFYYFNFINIINKVFPI